MLRRGYLRMGRMAGVDLRLHWTVPLGALFFGGLRFEPWLWLGFLLVVGVHQAGHALLGTWSGLRLASIDVSGVGGDCRWGDGANRVALGVAAWGGVLAQVLLLVVAAGVLHIWGTASRITELAHQTFVRGNGWILALNLLPLGPLDGARAWRLPAALRASGWNLRQALYGRLVQWARRRRDARGLERAAPPSLRSEKHAASEHGLMSSSAPDVDVLHEEENEPRPSPEAQRELDALLERIEVRAAQGRRRR